MGSKMVLAAHSIGDTQAIIDIVDELQKKEGVKPNDILILALGQPAHDKFLGKKPVAGMEADRYYGSSVVSLQHVLNKDVFQQARLTPDQLQIVMTQVLEKIEFKSVLLGNPSIPECEIPFQLAEAIAKSKNIRPLVYNDYLFEDMNTVLVNAAKNPDTYSWIRCLDLLLVNKHAQRRFHDTYKVQTSSTVVGHRIIDAALSVAPPSSESLVATRKALNVTDDMQLVFLSGSKETELDQAVFAAAMGECAKHEHGRLVVGMHPGHPELLEYTKTLLLTLNKQMALHKNLLNQIRIVIPDKMISSFNGFEQPLAVLLLEFAAQNSMSTVFKSCCVLPREHKGINLTGDGLADASDAVLGGVPGQLLFKTGLSGRPAASYQTFEMDLPGVYGGSKYLPVLFQKSDDSRIRRTRKECGVPEESMSEIVAHKL